MRTLFDASSVGALGLPNRILMAPMTRIRSNPEGLATASMATYYAQRAAAGLIVSEGIWPSPVAQSNPFTPGLATDAQAESWEQVTRAVHANGGRIFAQLQHSGRISHPDTTGMQPVGPSAVAARDTVVFTPDGPLPAPVPHALSPTEVAREAQSYAAAARRAIHAGFDGVELHGANGYLIEQFLAGSANQRTDSYGGSIAGRIRFAIEAVAASADAVGAARTGIRLSPSTSLQDAVKEDVPELYGALLAELAPLGLAYVHLTGTDEKTMAALSPAWPGTLIVNPTGYGTPAPTDRKSAEHWLDLGADLISFGRAFLANPDLVERLRADLPLTEADEATFYQGGDEGYLTYTAYRSQP